jgi:hypothetical protein
VREAKKGKDIKRYLEAQNHLETVGPQEREATRDKIWMDMTEKQNQAETQRLEAESKRAFGYVVVQVWEFFEVLTTHRWVMKILATTTKLLAISQEHSIRLAV